jgi:hypothetical protein
LRPPLTALRSGPPRGEFTDAAMMRDYDRFASLFTYDDVWRIPDANVEPAEWQRVFADMVEDLGLGAVAALSMVCGRVSAGSPNRPRIED